MKSLLIVLACSLHPGFVSAQADFDQRGPDIQKTLTDARHAAAGTPDAKGTPTVQARTANEIFDAFIRSLEPPIIVVLPEDYLLRKNIFTPGQSGQYVGEDYFNAPPLRKFARERFIGMLADKLKIKKEKLPGNLIVLKATRASLAQKSHESFHYIWSKMKNSGDPLLIAIPGIFKDLYDTRLDTAQREEIEKDLNLETYDPTTKQEEFWASFLETQYGTLKKISPQSGREKILIGIMEPQWALGIGAQGFYNSVFSFFDRLPKETLIADPS